MLSHSTWVTDMAKKAKTALDSKSGPAVVEVKLLPVFMHTNYSL